MENDYDVETYSLNQVMEMLDIKQKAVYNLADRGHIKALDFFHGKRTVYHYTQESVDRFLREKSRYITIPELAAEFNVSKSAFFNFLQKNDIHYDLDEIHYPRKTAVVTLSEANRIRMLWNELEKRPSTVRKSDFYKNGFGLYQLFSDPSGNLVRLVTDRNSNHWGFFSYNSFTPLYAALEKGYTPKYVIKDIPAKRSPYAIFTAASYDKSIRTLIDLAYQKIGFRNMYITQSNNEIQIHLKEGTIPLTEEEQSSLSEDWIKNANKDGFSAIVEGRLVIESGMKTASYFIKSNVAKWIDEYASEHELQPGEVIELAMGLLREAGNSE